MGDPLSIAASAFGTVSLGITVCSGLLSYYSSWKDSEKDIATMYISLEELTKTFKVLRRTIEGRSFTEEIVERITESIVSCEARIKSLEKRLAKLKDSKSTGIEGKIRTQARKASYPFRESTLIKTREIVLDLRANLGLALDTLHIDALAMSQQTLENLGSTSIKISQGIEELRHGQDEQNATIENEKTLRILEWLSPLSFGARLTDMLNRRQEGTGSWLLDTQEFKDWLNGTIRTVWCPGMQGAGKTILASTIIKHLQETFNERIEVAIGYVYCVYNEVDQTASNFMASLLQQFCRQQACIPHEIVNLYAHHTKMNTSPSVSELSKLLRSLFHFFTKVFIVVDALDECSNGTREPFLDELRNLPANVHLLVTSRPHAFDERTFECAAHLEIYAHEADVHQYLHGKIENQALLLRHIAADPSLRDTIIDTIVDKTRGMFLLAELHITSLAQEKSRRRLRRTLETLPEGIDETYDKAMLRIRSQDRADVECATQVLSWAIFAQRPMTIEQLRCAMAVEPEDTDLDEEALPDSDSLLSVCCGLVVVEGGSNIVRLIHYTTQEYFKPVRHSEFSSAQRYLTETCIIYLSFQTFSSMPCSEVPLDWDEELVDDRVLQSTLQNHVFLGYAAQHWGNHAREALSYDSSVNGMVKEFLSRKANVSYSIEIAHKLGAFSWMPSPKHVLDLHIVATFGIQQLTRTYLEEGVHVDDKDSNGLTALHKASLNGHTNVVQSLLENGANPRAEDKYDKRDALDWAAFAGHESTVRLLLESGRVVPSETVMSTAAGRGHSGIIRILLEKLTDLEARTIYLGSGLIEASFKGQEGCVRLLLEEGKSLEPSLVRHYAGEALKNASSSGRRVIMELCLEYGADVNVTDNRGWTPLHLNSNHCRVEATRLLLDNGANIEATDEKGNRPLHVAVRSHYYFSHQHEETVLLLLERGANVNVYGGDGEPALITAAKQGFATLIPHLLHYGADTTAKDDGYSRTSLEWAVLHGHLDVVRMLLTSEHSASIQEGLLVLTQLYHAMKPLPPRAVGKTKDENVQDTSELVLKLKALQSEDFRRFLLLHRPAAKGDEAVVRFFIDMGADVGAEWGQGERALHQAVKHGHNGIVRILLDYKAEIEAFPAKKTSSLSGGTPLCCAASSGQSATVQLLLDRGAYIEHDADKYGTPLMQAIGGCHEATVRVLLDNGANPNAATSNGHTTALHRLVSWVNPSRQSDLTLLLISKGANVEAKNSKGQTPLLVAVRRGRVNMVKSLLEQGADPNAVPETTIPVYDWRSEARYDKAMQLVREAKQRQAGVHTDDSCVE